MTNDKIMAGIWGATNRRELSLHVDNWQTAVDMGECSYSSSDLDDMRLAMQEVIENNFQRVLH